MSPVVAATSQDAQELAQLVFASAPLQLTELFGQGDQLKAQAFLQRSFQSENGQYGYANHFVIRKHQVVACACVWHDRLASDFDKATLAAIVAFFGAEQAMQILLANQSLQGDLQFPQAHQLALGHLSVAESARKQGLAKVLIEHASQIARRLNKAEICVDVDKTNTAALALYSKCNFNYLSTSPSGKHERWVRTV
ncbi:GNAT family N-acetyltransferase [Alteromonas flava]|uniref:GNAT family N-acetyltransferase n=1 Tax=Alteromonas flava TaxID=2048003 RepID=UPI000C290C4D|nr:GNAT family N-acetyltransferase [Alteromonas flava]